MQLKFTTFKDRVDLVEASPKNFINDLGALKNYIDGFTVCYFVNVKGVKGVHNAPFDTYKDAHIHCEQLVESGYPEKEIYISVMKQDFATADDIDC